MISHRFGNGGASPTLLLLSLCLLSFMPAIGCSKKEALQKSRELVVLCGSSFVPPTEQLCSEFTAKTGIKVVSTTAGSEDFLPLVKTGQKGDILVTHDPYLDYVRDARACAIGRKTKQIFARNNIAWEDVEKNVAFQSLTVNELGMQIQAGSLDAVIVWDAIARYYSEHGTEVPIPVEENVISTVNIGILTFTKYRSLAEQFVQFAASPHGQDIFKQHNYHTDLPQ